MSTLTHNQWWKGEILFNICRKTFEIKQINRDTAVSLDDEDDLDYELSSSREARLMIYWTTITKKSTTTSYLSTSTIASVICTPSNFIYKTC